MKTFISKPIFATIALLGASQAFAIECQKPEDGFNTKFVGSNNAFHCSIEKARFADAQRANLYKTNVHTGTWVQRAPSQPVQFVPVVGTPGHFVNAGNVYHCPALAKWGGLFLGAFIGNEAGKRIKIFGGTASVGGTVVGAVAGEEILCDIVRPAKAVAIASPQGTVVNQGVSGTVTVPGSCIVEGVSYPEYLDKPVECRAKWAEVLNKSNPAPAATAQAFTTYGKVPTKINGHTCYVDDKKNGEILADFLDASKNLKRIVVTTSDECAKERAEFSAKFAQK